MSLLILKASVAHTAITNVIINNKVIVYSFVILYFFLRCKITIVCAHRQDFLTKREKQGGRNNYELCIINYELFVPFTTLKIGGISEISK